MVEINMRMNTEELIARYKANLNFKSEVRLACTNTSASCIECPLPVHRFENAIVCSDSAESITRKVEAYVRKYELLKQWSKSVCE